MLYIIYGFTPKRGNLELLHKLPSKSPHPLVDGKRGPPRTNLATIISLEAIRTIPIVSFSPVYISHLRKPRNFRSPPYGSGHALFKSHLPLLHSSTTLPCAL